MELLFLACATLCKFDVLDKLFAQENLNRFAPIVKQKKRAEPLSPANLKFGKITCVFHKTTDKLYSAASELSSIS